MTPRVDAARARFTYGRPDSELLQHFCWDKFGWTKVQRPGAFLWGLREGERRARKPFDLMYCLTTLMLAGFLDHLKPLDTYKTSSI